MFVSGRRRRSRSRDRRRRSRSKDRRRSPRRERIERKFPLVKHERPDDYQYSNVAVPDTEEYEFNPNMPMKIKDIKKEEKKEWDEEDMRKCAQPPEAMDINNDSNSYKQFPLKGPAEIKDEPQ